MALSGYNAEASLYKSGGYRTSGTSTVVGGSTAVVPQLCAGSPCVNLNIGRQCLSLPIVGRVCVNIPSFGRWRVRCCTRWGWPPISCGISRC